MPTEEEIREICGRVTPAQDFHQFNPAYQAEDRLWEHITDAVNRGVHFSLLKNQKPKLVSRGNDTESGKSWQ